MKRRLNQIKESAVHAYKALRTNVMRTILSLLGVTTGIFCIISVSALVDSIDRSVQETFSVISDDMIFIQKMPMMPDESGEYKWWEYMRRKNITQKQASMLRERMNLAHAVSYQIGTMETVEHLNSFASNVQVAGVSYEYNQAIEVDIGDGRYFTQMESQSGKSVALVGSNVAEKLFGEGVSSVGKEIKVGGYKMTVIGQFAKAGNNLLPGGFDDAVMVPAKFSSKFVDPKYAETSVVIKAKDGVSTDELKEEAINTLRPIRKLKPKKENDFAVIEATFFSEILDGIFSMVRGAGIAIGFCALLVGGLAS